MIIEYWVYDNKKNTYSSSSYAPLSAFPTIVNIEKHLVFCRIHHCWESITAFSSNKLQTACGKIYDGPFTLENSIFNYGFEVKKTSNNYSIRTLSQTTSIKNRRLIDNHFEIKLNQKQLLKNDVLVFEEKDISGFLCTELTNYILDDIGEKYKKDFGIKPTISSAYSGFSIILGYLLSPFNVNFYKIAKHWGLHPYDKDFTSLSSGTTPNAENEMFASLGIHPTKSIRKIYQKNPYGVIAYAAVKDLGFTDVNILQKSTTINFYSFFNLYMISFANGNISYQIRNQLRAFTTDMLAISNEKTVWNSLERTIKYLFSNKTIKKNSNENLLPNQINVTDGINMYCGISHYLTEKEKKEIMSEGFNSYTHDFLLRRQNELSYNSINKTGLYNKDENLLFPIEKYFLDLEYKCGEAFCIDKKTGNRLPIPDEQRWCFYVAKDSDTLRTIGSEMSNCVGWGYKDSVYSRRATIVYALYKKQYKICIEVTPSFSVRQAFGPHNTQLNGEAFEAYSEWCKEKGIVRQNVFSVRAAP